MLPRDPHDSRKLAGAGGGFVTPARVPAHGRASHPPHLFPLPPLPNLRLAAQSAPEAAAPEAPFPVTASRRKTQRLLRTTCVPRKGVLHETTPGPDTGPGARATPSSFPAQTFRVQRTRSEEH